MPLTILVPESKAIHHLASTALPAPKWRISLLLGLVTAVFLWMSYFPWEWGFLESLATRWQLPAYPQFPLNMGFIAWFALVPFLTMVRRRTSTRSAFFAAWLSGFVFYMAVLEWTRVAHPYMYATWVALSLYCSLYFAVAVPLLRRLDRILPMTISLPLVWVSLEFLRAHLMTGFAWYFLGHTQHNELALIQIADLGGVYGVTALLAMGNGLFFEGLRRWRWFRERMAISEPDRPRCNLAFQVGVTAALLAAVIGYGTWRLHQQSMTEGPRIAVLQCSVDQATRNSRGVDEDATISMFKRMEELTRETAHLAPVPDLLIWPETTYPDNWIEIHEGVPPAEVPEKLHEFIKLNRELAKKWARFSKTNILIGLNCDELMPGGRYQSYNSALLLQTDGSARGRYDKIHCVPFGEYVPMRNTFPWMQVFSPYKHDYSLECGSTQTRFDLPLADGRIVRFGTLICYEDSVPSLAPGYLSTKPDDAPIDFLVNMTNDGWFDGSEEHEQHLAISRFRAIENRRSLVRSVNMGISAVIDANGRIVALPAPTWKDSKKIATVFAARVPIDSRSSLYTQVGDGFAGLCALALFVAFGAAGWRKTDKSTAKNMPALIG